MTGSTSKLSHPASLAGAAKLTAARRPHVAAAARLRRRPLALGTLASRTALLIVVAAAVTLGVQLGRPDVVATDPDLARLLRFMALLKAGLAGVAIAALYWRLAEPVTPVRFAGYLIAVAAAAAGPGLIWSMHHLVLGAVSLHGGLAALVVLLWRDPATSARLAGLLRSRSRAPNRHSGNRPWNR